MKDDAVDQLVRSLFEERSSLLDRVRGVDHRLATLAEIAETYEARVIPDLMPLLAMGDPVASQAARTIAGLARYLTAAQLHWLDEQVREKTNSYYSSGPWQQLSPGAVSSVAHVAAFDPTVVGFVASHANGFVRAAALEELARSVDGREIAFLALRANDWVAPVAARASELLIGRLRPANLSAVIDALPSIVRVLGQRRRDHADIERSLQTVLLSDGGEQVLAHGNRFATPVRRKIYELMARGAARQRVLESALRDFDAVIRARAIKSIVMHGHFDDRDTALRRLLKDDPLSAVRRLILSLLSEQMPDHVAAAFPDVLLDPSAGVRGLARYMIKAHRLPLVPRDVYLGIISAPESQHISAAIEGLGETGTREDADLIAPFLDSPSPRNRRAALRALGRLDAERVMTSSMTALADPAPSVRNAAAGILARNSTRVHFDRVHERIRGLADPAARRALLRLLASAPKWDAIAFLLEALADPDEGVRARAVRLLERWIATFNSSHTQPTPAQLARLRALVDTAADSLPDAVVRMLRFSTNSA